MKASSSKEKILKKIRQALAHPVPVPFPQSEGANSVFKPSTQELEYEFAENFTSLLGKFSFCIDERELAAQLHQVLASKGISAVHCNDAAIEKMLATHNFNKFNNADLASAQAAITGCEALVARTGSIVLTSAQAGGRTVSVYAPVHICIAYTDQLVYDIKDALQRLKEKYPKQLPSFITLATGPSRTADIEKTLVVGVHGPREVFVFLIDKR